MQLNEILTKAMNMGASDIHLKHGVMPVVRVHGKLMPIDKNSKRLTGDQIAEMAALIMSPLHRKKFAEIHEVDMGYGVAGLARFRINIFQQRGTVGMVIRAIPFNIKNLEDLNLPAAVSKITTYERGLILVTGITGSGKSTTLASMLDYINSNRTCHILTIEDPIEYLIRDRRSIINQRELGLDTPSFSMAIRQALRQDPDVIFIGEMRDTETIRTALVAAETGHLVFSTLHTADATETINRILSSFEPHEQAQVRLQLAASLRAVISQRLVTKIDNSGVVPACEIMVVNARIRDMIADPQKTREIPMAIEDGSPFDMQTFDQSLMSLLRQNLISFDEAKAASTNSEDFALRHKGVTSMDGKKWQGFDNSTQSSAHHSIRSVDIHTIPVIKGENRTIDDDQEDDED
ncbi:MAG: type IV pilus twitching motility protein PilT [Oligoflexia bacterium]|nr:type IV pilus twitching motility protein PilT [Oligoflexia bacterium]